MNYASSIIVRETYIVLSYESLSLFLRIDFSQLLYPNKKIEKIEKV